MTKCDPASHPLNPQQPHQGIAMDNSTQTNAARDVAPAWKTQEYHGKQIHVCTVLRPHDNDELDGHGDQWDFKVRVTEENADPAAAPCASADSDQAIFYSTQSVSEDLAFAKGRELVEAM